MRVNKNYFNFSFGQYCGVVIDEETMKKVAKLQYETKVKLCEILENSNNTYCSNWSITENPCGLSQEERTFHYYSEAENIQDRLKLTNHIFSIRKIKDLYCVENLTHLQALNKAHEEHTEHLKNLHGISGDCFGEVSK